MNLQTRPIAMIRPATVDATARPWSVAAVEELFKLPFADLLFQAQQVHRAHFETADRRTVA